jgi:diaminopimelate epimerase
MKIKCYKYQGAGNDFVLADNRQGNSDLTFAQIKFLCDRKFGIGADGLMLLGKSNTGDFSMKYYNSDGFEGTMCGNGGRCITAFAADSGIAPAGSNGQYIFDAIDGIHTAEIVAGEGKVKTVRLRIKDVQDITQYPDNKLFINTGSPHLIIFPEHFEETDVDKEGRYWRHHSSFPGGTNVNFVKVKETSLYVRTFERGVEAETLACGTGVTASALAYDVVSKRGIFGNEVIRKTGGDTLSVTTEVPGGVLEVQYKRGSDGYTDIYLTGPATYVFECDVEF